MSDRAFEAYQVTAPYQGSSGLAAVANIAVSQTARAINLSDYFGNLGNGHFYSVQADGAKVYIAVAPHDKQAIADNTQGSGPAACFPIQDGQTVPFVIPGGRTVGTSYGTNINFASGIILWAKVASALPTGGSPTGFLRIWRSSVGQTQGLEQFPPPGFPGPVGF